MKKIQYSLFVLFLVTVAFSSIVSASSSTNSVLDTIQVSSDGSITSSTIALQNGVTYQIIASGIYFTSTPTQDNQNDASYSSHDQWATHTNSVSGLYIDRWQLGSKQWGEYNSNHIYQCSMTGNGSKVNFWITDSNYNDNLGSLTVQISGPIVAPQTSTPTSSPAPTQSSTAPSTSPNSSPSSTPEVTVSPTQTAQPTTVETQTPQPTHNSSQPVEDNTTTTIIVIASAVIGTTVVSAAIMLVKRKSRN